MANEAEALDIRLAARLDADATLAGLVGTRIYNSDAWEGLASPYVLFELVSSVADEADLESGRTIASLLYRVRVVAREGTGLEGASAAADRIDTLLHGWRDLATTPHLLCERESEYRARIAIADDAYRYERGGYYRFRLMP